MATNTYEFAFTRPENWQFKSGQFILFDVPLIENPADIQTRAYSIAAAPSDAELMFVVKLKEGGRASRWFDELMEVGDPAVIQGPFGNFILPAEEERDLLFVATGAGIAPFRAMMHDALERKPERKVDCIFGVRTEDELFWVESLTELTQKYPAFSLHVSLSRPHDAWTGHRGRVQEIVPKITPSVIERTLFVCGNPDMTKEVKQLALEKWGVSKQHLHVEGFI